MSTLAQRLQAEIDRANAITTETDTTVHDAVSSLIEGYGQGNKTTIEWHQCPELPRNFISEVIYDSGDYSASQIADYAPQYGTATNYKPIGKTVGSKTFYNEVPNTETEFVSDNTYGTIKPLDQVRYINTIDAPNVRDLGGWSCDGGTVKYGLLYRGGEPTANDRSVLVDELGIRHDLDLRGSSEATWNESPLGEDVYFTRADAYNWYSITNKEAWKVNLRCVFDAVTHSEPVYFHCSAGADRTGTLACILEAILGVSQSDMDKDYELTSFYTGTYSDDVSRRRNEADWTGLINQITSLSVGETFRDKVLNWVASLGFTVDEINAFRTAMIDGTPDIITLNIDSFSISKNGTNITFDNDTESVTEYQGYSVNVSAESGYAISSVTVTMGGEEISAFTGEKVNLFRRITNVLTNCTTNNANYSCIDGQGYGEIIKPDSGHTLDGAVVSITMGGVDMTQHFYSNGVIIIPNVTGDVVINVEAVKQGPSYTNVWATPYKLNSRLNTSETDPEANGMYISAWYSTDGIDLSQDLVLRSNKNLWNYNKLSSSGDQIRGYNSMTANDKTSMPSTDMTNTSFFTRGYDEKSGIYSLTVKSDYWYGDYPKYIRFCAMTSQSPLTDSYFEGCILTFNEEIN